MFIKCNVWVFAKGFYVVVLLQHLHMQVAAPVWKILFLEFVSFSPQISQGLEDISESA
jgi:hypothetical protein